MKKDFLTLADLGRAGIHSVLNDAIAFKKNRKKNTTDLGGKVLGLVFEKESTRTKTSFEVAMIRLGGQSVYLNQQSSQISRGETYADTARVLSRYVDVIVMRTFSQSTLEEMARFASVPVINGLTDEHHPCQILADLLTLKEKGLDFTKSPMTYIGDWNNMSNSWVEAARLLEIPLTVCVPKSLWPKDWKMIESKTGVKFSFEPKKACAGAQAIHTDTWFSMGQKVSQKKKNLFKAFQVNESLLKSSYPNVLVFHCLPAHRGEEITDGVLDGPNSVVFDQAENRLYAQMALLKKLLT